MMWSDDDERSCTSSSYREQTPVADDSNEVDAKRKRVDTNNRRDDELQEKKKRNEDSGAHQKPPHKDTSKPTTSSVQPPAVAPSRPLSDDENEYVKKMQRPLEDAILADIAKDKLPQALRLRAMMNCTSISKAIVAHAADLAIEKFRQGAGALSAEASPETHRNAIGKRLLFALRDIKNDKLRLDVLEQKINPETLVRMDDEQLANPEAKEAIAKKREVLNYLRNAGVAALAEGTVTEMFHCPKCGHQRCFMVARGADKQKWGGDDATPVNLTCLQCNHAFRQ